MGLSPAPIATFPEASLRSRTVGFPESGSDLGISLVAFPRVARFKCRLTYAPHIHGSQTSSLLLPEPRSPARCPGVSWSRQVPRAPLPDLRCYRPIRATSSVASEDITPPSSLVRAHAPDHEPPAAFSSSPDQRVFAGCRQSLLVRGPSRRYLCESFLGCLDLSRGGSQGAFARFFPCDFGLPRETRRVGANNNPLGNFRAGNLSRSLSFLTFRPPSLLAIQVAPTATVQYP